MIGLPPGPPEMMRAKSARLSRMALDGGRDPDTITRASSLSLEDDPDTIARLVAYRDAGADVVYAPGLTDLAQIGAVVAALRVPVNVLALPMTPSIAELAAAGVRRVSVGSLLAAAAYGALVVGAGELLGPGTSTYAAGRLPRDLAERAFGREREV